MANARHVRRLLAVLVIWVVVLGLPAAPGLAALPKDLCADRVAAAKALEVKVKAHNAKPHHFTIPRQAAALAAYDAEAAELRAEASAVQASLKACLEVMVELADAQPGSPEMREVPASVRTKLVAAKENLPANLAPEPAPVPGANWEVSRTSPLRPYYDALRKATPGDPKLYYDVTLQGQTRPTLPQRDWAYPRAPAKS